MSIAPSANTMASRRRACAANHGRCRKAHNEAAISAPPGQRQRDRGVRAELAKGGCQATRSVEAGNQHVAVTMGVMGSGHNRSVVDASFHKVIGADTNRLRNCAAIARRICASLQRATGSLMRAAANGPLARQPAGSAGGSPGSTDSPRGERTSLWFARASRRPREDPAVANMPFMPRFAARVSGPAAAGQSSPGLRARRHGRRSPSHSRSGA
jgi:hypothetical protein